MSKYPFAAACLVAAAVLPFSAPAAAAAAAQNAVAAAQGPVSAMKATTLTAVVQSIDLATRTVTLKGESGNVYDFEVSPELKNLDKVKVGDTVAVNHTRAVAVRIATSAEAGRSGAVTASTTPPGTGKPITAGAQVTERLKVNAVDLTNNTVTLTGPEGATETVDVLDPQLRERLKTLKAGDELFVTYSESVALSVLPTGTR